MATGNEGEKAPSHSVVTREGGDICRWTFVGDISEAEMRKLLADQKAIMEGCERVLLLIDMARVGDVSPEARKAGAEPSNVNAIGTAIYGASFHIRVLAKLVTTASAVLRKAKHTDSPVNFFETEREALVWLDQRRAEVVKK
jgi:hypothetical protein